MGATLASLLHAPRRQQRERRDRQRQPGCCRHRRRPDHRQPARLKSGEKTLEQVAQEKSLEYVTGILIGNLAKHGIKVGSNAVKQIADKMADNAALAKKGGVQFGGVPNQVSHTFRHTDAIGLSREAVHSDS
ncbi:MAG: hypothetical protein FWD51_03335 [Betaproteobacteria bacterium]|nr:hypothetical protein [Betaproteobacteria bacterium]